MTSKEALEQIKEFGIVREHESVPYEIIKPIKEYYVEEISIIEKSLEMLEIIKEHPSLLCCFAHDGIWTWEQYQAYYNDEDKEFIGATQEEFNKLKEWLDNE